MGEKGIKYYQYFVEGEDERKLINTLKSEMEMIEPGKVQVFNCVSERLTALRLMTLKDGTAVVLVFDSDAGNLALLEDNINLIRKQSNICDVFCIVQVKNLEDELVYACDIKQIKELLGVDSNSAYKRALLREKNLSKKLREHDFDIAKFWSKQDKGAYKDIENQAGRIKKK